MNIFRFLIPKSHKKEGALLWNTPSLKKHPDCPGQNRLVFFNGDGVAFAHFNAGFATEAFLVVGRIGFAVVHFVHFDRTNIHAFTATNTLVGIDSHIPAHLLSSRNFWTITTGVPEGTTRIVVSALASRYKGVKPFLLSCIK